MTATVPSAFELRALVRSLEWSKETAFFFVVADDTTERETALEAIRAALPKKKLRILRVKSETHSVLDAVRTLAPFGADEIVAITGPEAAVGAADGAESSDVVRGLNASR